MELHVIRRMPPAKRKKIHRYLRMALQMLFFLLYPSAFTAAFGGIKYIFIQLGISEEIALTPFVTILLGICIYTILFGRFFCGFACAFGSFGDALHGIYMGIGRKWKRKLPGSVERIPEKIFWIKYIVLAAIVLMCFAGVYDRARNQSMGCVFHGAGWESEACRLLPGGGGAASADGGDVCLGALFLPGILSDGSRVFASAGAARVFIAQRQRQLPRTLRRLHRAMPFPSGAAGGSQHRDAGGLFSMSEMHRHLSQGKYSLRIEAAEWE